MTVLQHEMRTGRKTLIIWTLAIAFFLAICVLMFPEMQDSMEGVDVFAQMGSFTDAFGMDQLNFATLIGFYGIECGNIIGIGGSMFAAMIAISMISKEEKNHTAEFLFTHPLGRSRILAEKLAALGLNIMILNAISYLTAIASIFMIDEEIPWKELNLLHGAYLLVQIEIALICFGISAFIKSNGFGVGLGLAIIFYFLNILANITDKVEFLKKFTPFGYADSAELIAAGKLDWKLIICGMVIGIICTIIGWIHYIKKNLQ